MAWPFLTWVVFVAVQALDGMLTCLGIQTFGTGVEANPLIAWYMHAVGPATAVWGAKVFAVGCGMVLHLLSRHHVLASLAALYLLCAIGPWLHLLWPL